MLNHVYTHLRRNVIAYIALFFALGGVAVAAPKYIAAGDPANGDLTGTYPGPQIAPGTVTSGKFASSAKAPDADRLDGKDSSAYGAVLSAQINGIPATSDFSNPTTLDGAVTGISTGTTQHGAIQTLSPAQDMVASDMQVETTQNYYLGRKVTLLVNGQETALSCTEQNGANNHCSDTTDQVPVPAGSRLSLRVVNPGSGNTEAFVGLRLTPAP